MNWYLVKFILPLFPENLLLKEKWLLVLMALCLFSITNGRQSIVAWQGWAGKSGKTKNPLTSNNMNG
jgi:hypothetical protein